VERALYPIERRVFYCRYPIRMCPKIHEADRHPTCVDMNPHKIQTLYQGMRCLNSQLHTIVSSKSDTAVASQGIIEQRCPMEIFYRLSAHSISTADPME